MDIEAIHFDTTSVIVTINTQISLNFRKAKSEARSISAFLQ